MNRPRNPSLRDRPSRLGRTDAAIYLNLSLFFLVNFSNLRNLRNLRIEKVFPTVLELTIDISAPSARIAPNQAKRERLRTNMPRYEFQCENCSHTFELTQRFSDPPPKKCPRCQGPVQKVFHPVGIIFKGSGFHVNDYGKYGAKDNGGSPPPAESRGDSSAKPSDRSHPPSREPRSDGGAGSGDGASATPPKEKVPAAED